MTGTKEPLGTGAVVLRGLALPYEGSLLEALEQVITQAPFRHMTTPGGYRMSVGMTNCGVLGWVTDRKGYRYATIDPESKEPWPSMPEAFTALAQQAALEAGYDDFQPDACLINRYVPENRLTLHQDKNEVDFYQPIVSVSLGVPAVFQFGGFERSDPIKRIRLVHGDVVVWGGEDRLRYHGIMPLKVFQHPILGEQRINLTFRKAG